MKEEVQKIIRKFKLQHCKEIHNLICGKTYKDLPDSEAFGIALRLEGEEGLYIKMLKEVSLIYEKASNNKLHQNALPQIIELASDTNFLVERFMEPLASNKHYKKHRESLREMLNLKPQVDAITTQHLSHADVDNLQRDMSHMKILAIISMKLYGYVIGQERNKSTSKISQAIELNGYTKLNQKTIRKYIKHSITAWETKQFPKLKQQESNTLRKILAYILKSHNEDTLVQLFQEYLPEEAKPQNIKRIIKYANNK